MDVICVVEALDDKDEWKLIWTKTGDKEEVEEEGKAVSKQWTEAGFPKDQIRMTSTQFAIFKKRYRDED